MSSPKVIIEIVIAGAQIFARAFAAAGRQAYKNAQHRPAGGMAQDGVGNATSGSQTDKLTREMRMTLDEARLILNTKKGQDLETVMQHYEHLFKANCPPPPPEKPPSGEQVQKFTSSRAAALQNYHSHYLLSKVVRARERIENELKMEAEAAKPKEAAAESGSTPEPPKTPPESSDVRPPPPPPPS